MGVVVLKLIDRQQIIWYTDFTDGGGAKTTSLQSSSVIGRFGFRNPGGDNMIRVRTVLTCITAIAIFGAGTALAGGAEVPWTMSYDALTSRVTFTADNETQQVVLSAAELAETYFRVTATGEVSDDAGGRGRDVFRVSGRVLAGGSVVSGQVAMDWTGNPAPGTRPVFHLEVISATTAYVEPRTWGHLKSMFNS
jgi:hypothetical protein